MQAEKSTAASGLTPLCLQQTTVPLLLPLALFPPLLPPPLAMVAVRTTPPGASTTLTSLATALRQHRRKLTRERTRRGDGCHGPLLFCRAKNCGPRIAMEAVQA